MSSTGTWAMLAAKPGYGLDLPPGAAGRWRSVHTSTAINGKGAPAALAAPATPSCRDMARAATTSATSFASQS